MLSKLFWYITLFCLSLNIYGAIAIDSQEASNAGHRSASPLSWTFNNVAGTKLVCGFVVVKAGTGPTISTPTYNSVNMVLAGAQLLWGVAAGVESKGAIYYLDSPATGSNTVSVTGGGDFVLGGCISYTGTATGVGTNTTGSGTSGTTATAGSITTASGNYVFATGGWGSGGGGTAGAGFTRTFVLNGSGGYTGDDILGEYGLSSGAALSPKFSWTGSDYWGILATEITASGGGAVQPKTLMTLGVGL